MSGPPRFTNFSGLIRVHCQISVSFTGHVRLQDQTYPVSSNLRSGYALVGLILPSNRVLEVGPGYI
jgi:hypothetical protein